MRIQWRDGGLETAGGVNGSEQGQFRVHVFLLRYIVEKTHNMILTLLINV